MTRSWRARMITASRLGLHDWLVVAESLVLLAWVELAIRVGAPSRVLSWATTPHRVNGTEPSEAEIRRLTWLHGMAANYHPMGPRCLTRSLSLARLLSRAGVVTQLKVGVNQHQGRLTAHAWVERNGRVLNDDVLVHQEFAVFGDPLDSSTA